MIDTRVDQKVGLHIRPRFKRRRIILVAAVVLIMAMAGGALAVVETYQPIRPGSASGCSPGPSGHMVETHNFGRECIYKFQARAKFGYFFHLTNDGPFGVTVIGFPFFGGANKLESILVGPENTDDPAAAHEFRPFALAPHHSVMLHLSYRLSNCSSKTAAGVSGSSYWKTQDIRFRVAGIERTREFDLPFGIAIEDIPNGC